MRKTKGNNISREKNTRETNRQGLKELMMANIRF